MAGALGIPTGPGFTSPNLAPQPPQGTMTSSEVGTRAIQVVNPSSEEPNYFDPLPIGLLARICSWLDKLSICNLAIASRRCLQDVMGLSGAQRLLEPSGLWSLVGPELPTDMSSRGYDLRGRIEQVGVFSIGNFQDLFQKAKLTPEWNLVPDELKAIFERSFTAFRDSLVKKLEKYKELQGADFSRLFNLITSGEIDASFSRPPKGLTEAQKQKIEELLRTYRQLNDLVISLVKRCITDIAPRLPQGGLEPSESKQVFTGIITLLKESGDLQVEETEIEKLVLENLPYLLKEMPPPNNIAAINEACTFLITELLRFELAKLIPEERLQLAATLHETFDIVKPLFGISVKLFIDQLKAETEADHQAQIAARPPALRPGPFFQPPRPVRWLSGLGSQLIMGINAYGISSFALSRLSIPHQFNPLTYQLLISLGIFLGISHLRDQIRNHPQFSVREKLTMLSGIGSFLIAALAIEGLSPVIDRYFDSPVGYMCARDDSLDLMRSYLGEMRILEGEDYVLMIFLGWSFLTALINI